MNGAAAGCTARIRAHARPPSRRLGGRSVVIGSAPGPPSRPLRSRLIRDPVGSTALRRARGRRDAHRGSSLRARCPGRRGSAGDVSHREALAVAMAVGRRGHEADRVSPDPDGLEYLASASCASTSSSTSRRARRRVTVAQRRVAPDEARLLVRDEAREDRSRAACSRARTPGTRYPKPFSIRSDRSAYIPDRPRRARGRPAPARRS